MRVKLKRFKDNQASSYVLEPNTEEYYAAVGRWHEVFGNNHPIVLELGCGKGAYTIGLAQMHPEWNIVGIDIKGDRIWHGAQAAEHQHLSNVRFLRMRIEQIDQFFAPGEVSEIWITFPDPHPRKRSEKRRMTNVRFLQKYASILKPRGIVHLKTDSQMLWEHTQKEVQKSRLFSIKESSANIANTYPATHLLHTIQTPYEMRYRAEGRSITYLKLQKKRMFFSKYTPWRRRRRTS